jgi:MFS family permease
MGKSKNKWLNRNIFAMGLTSFFSDFGHEMATAILPAFLVSLGGSAALLGVIEGIADASISGMKLFSGWYSDYIGKRKPFAAIGYLLTAIGVGSFSLAFSWPHVLLSRVVAWLGRGTREPPRDALLVDSTKPEFRGRVFGFHRGMDTLGAIAGPAIAFFLIKSMPLRSIFLVALIPSVVAFLIIVFFVKEKRKGGGERSRFLVSVRGLPRNFRFFLIAVGVFGLGNFADSMLILRATELLSPLNGAVVAGSLAILLYTIHNVFYAVFSFPIGILADKIGKRKMLVFGYLLTGLSSIGFIFPIGNIFYLGLLFVVAGVAIAITDAMERTIAADLLPENLRGTGYGTLATVNGIGDFASSSVVGLLWTAVSPAAGFGYGAALCTLGAVILATIKRRDNKYPEQLVNPDIKLL